MVQRLVGFFFCAVLFLALLIPLPVTAQEDVAGDSLTAPATVYDSLFLKERRPQPAFNIQAEDLDNDGGGAVEITWDKSPDDFEGGLVKEYLILRAESPDGPFAELGNATKGIVTFTDNQAEAGQEFFYKVLALNFEKVNGEYLWRATSESAVEKKPRLRLITMRSSSVSPLGSFQSAMSAFMLISCGIQ